MGQIFPAEVGPQVKFLIFCHFLVVMLGFFKKKDGWANLYLRVTYGIPGILRIDKIYSVLLQYHSGIITLKEKMACFK